MQHIFLFAFLHQSYSFINRNPGCVYTANYTTILHGKYFKSNEDHIVVPSLSAKNCSMRCTMNDLCFFYNQNIHSGQCELIQSRSGEMIDLDGWVFVSTDYSDWKYRGPRCRHLRPDCYFTSFCVDSCISPGYKCERMENVALMKETKASSILHHAKYAVDGGNKSFCSGASEKEWLRVDLAQKYEIYFLFMNLDHRFGSDSLTSITIRIGNIADERESNDVCVYNRDYTNNTNALVRCRGGNMIGRYIYVIRENVKSPYFLCVEELRVYGIKDDLYRI